MRGTVLIKRTYRLWEIFYHRVPFFPIFSLSLVLVPLICCSWGQQWGRRPARPAPSPPWPPGTAHSTGRGRRHSSHSNSFPESHRRGQLLVKLVIASHLNVVSGPGRVPEPPGGDAGQEAAEEGTAAGRGVETVGILADQAGGTPGPETTWTITGRGELDVDQNNILMTYRSHSLHNSWPHSGSRKTCWCYWRSDFNFQNFSEKI